MNITTILVGVILLIVLLIPLAFIGRFLYMLWMGVEVTDMPEKPPQCQHCGRDVEKEWRVCAYCGKPLN